MKKPDFSEEIRNAQSATVTYFLIIVDNESQKKTQLNPDNHFFQNRLAVGRILETISRYGKLESPGKSGRLSVASPGMSIIVVCPGCGKRFKVSDKFAGKIGPCPNCKQPIKVPLKGEEVKIHVPEQFAEGGHGASGQLLAKPIARQETKFNFLYAIAVAGVALLILAAALAGGKMDLFENNVFLTILGLMLISPPLAVTAYSFLYNDELAPYKGKSLFIRATICGLFYVLLWGFYTYLAHNVLSGELWNWVFVAPPFFFTGAIAASLTLDLELGNAFFHYSFYLLVTIVLRWAAGMDWIWNIK